MNNEMRENKTICKNDGYGKCDKYIDFDDVGCCGCFGKDYSTCEDFEGQGEEQNNE